MLFKRRVQATSWERFRVWLWPRVSWRRSGNYFFKRTVRLSGRPHAIALGAAVGAGISCTPLFGFHVLIALALAWLLRGNLIAGAIGTAFGNPLTFPFILAAAYELGQFMLRGRAPGAMPRLSHDLADRSLDQVWPVVKPMLVGSAPLGILAGCVVYLVVFKAVAAYQRTRRERLADRREASSPERRDAEMLARTG